jgi:cold shock CspA family protein
MGKKRKAQKGSSNKQKQHGRRRAPKAAERQQRSSGRLFQGKVDKKQSGFAFLIPIDQGFEDVYVNRRDAASLMNGDIVEFSVEHQGRRSQARLPA